MTNNTVSTKESMSDVEIRQQSVGHVVRIFISLLIQAAILFLTSWQLNWLGAWVYLGLGAVVMLYKALIFMPKHRELFAEREKARQDARGWDKWLVAIITVFGPWTMLAVAGLDQRFNWTPETSLAILLAGAALYVLGQSLINWSMASNAFFSSMVRVQEDRGHEVASGGPYKYVRHPAYIGVVIFTIGSVLVLGSYWAFIPAALTMAAVIIRTALEDKTLQQELDGYEAYAADVKYRLVPWIW